MQTISMPGVGLNDAVDDSFQAFLVDGAFFTHNEEYPILREDMISTRIPKKNYALQQGNHLSR